MKLFLILTLGIASFYGREFSGRKMANGKLFNPNELTAASNSYKLGTKLRVRFLRTNRSVCVEVTDRGPNVKNRIIDLSKHASDVIGLTPYGIGRVRVTEGCR